jgi:hypothetical protein
MAAWRYGVPIAIVLFLALLAVSLVLTLGRAPSAAEAEGEAVQLLTQVFTQTDLFPDPADNPDKTEPTIYPEPERNVIVFKVHGVLGIEDQNRLLAVLTEARREEQTRPVVVRFHYPEAFEPDPNAPKSRTPIYADDPTVLREVRL